MKFKCPSCGAVNAGDAIYCIQCQRKLPLLPLSSLIDKTDRKEVPLWEDRGQDGLLKAFWLTAKEILFSPKSFFSRLFITGGFSSPLKFGVFAYILPFFVAGIFLIISLAIRKSPLLASINFSPFTFLIIIAFILLSVLLDVVSICVKSVFIHISCLFVGAKKGFQASFRVVSYSQVISLLNIFLFPALLFLEQNQITSLGLKTRLGITFFSFAIVKLIGEFTLYLIGCKYTHNLRPVQAVNGILIYFILLCAISYVKPESCLKNRVCPLIEKGTGRRINSRSLRPLTTKPQSLEQRLREGGFKMELTK